MLKRLPDDPTNWLLIKERDPAARPLAEYDVLVRGAQQRRHRPAGRRATPAPRKRRARARRPRRSPARSPRPMPAQWKPQLAVAGRRAAADGKGWLHEIKYDGYRTLVFFEAGKVRLITRNGHDWTASLRRARQGVREAAVQERDPRRRGGGAGRARRHLAQPAGAGAVRGRQPRLHLLRLRPRPTSTASTSQRREADRPQGGAGGAGRAADRRALADPVQRPRRGRRRRAVRPGQPAWASRASSPRRPTPATCRPARRPG